MSAGGALLFWSLQITSLSDIDLTTLTVYAVNPLNTQSHVVLHRTKEIGDLPNRQANTFNVVFG
jgi:hypothetical protein